MTGALAVGVAAGVAYVAGGALGGRALEVVSPGVPSPDTLTGAQWAGRVTTFLVLVAVMGRL